MAYIVTSMCLTSICLSAGWYNIPLCLGMYFIPCCSCVVYLRNMEKMTGKSCESNCLTCCVLSLCCHMNLCYYAKKRGELRKKYGLIGSPCFDCLGCMCFGPCMICQDANDLQVQSTRMHVHAGTVMHAHIPE
jgi:Cys-rich protein (TIGR01571 family)